MEDFTKHESRPTPTTELKEQQNYRELVPRPSDEDYQRLKQDIARNGFDETKPIVVNDDEVVLDGHTRLQIARELGLEWVYTMVKELEDHYAEKRYIIQKNLDQRHMTVGQKIDMGEKLLEIKQEEARDRQRQSGINYKGNLNNHDCELCKTTPVLVGMDEVGDAPYRLPPALAEAGEKGEAIELTARVLGIGKETFRKGLKIKEVAQTDPEVAESWNKVKQGGATVNQVYQQIQEKSGKKKEAKKKLKPEIDETSLASVFPRIREKTYVELMMERVPDPEPFPDDELLDGLYAVADAKGIPREAIDGAIELEKVEGPGPGGESDIMAWFRWWSQALFDIELAWDMTMDWVERWQQQQRTARPQEVPVPDDSKKLGPWALDFVHQAGLQDLARDFPVDSAHLIYSDALVDVEQVGLLGEFAARALTEGKYLCVYVDKRHLPEAMVRLSAGGLTYFWSCMVFRAEAQEVAELKIKEIWRLMLIYQKGESLSPGWDWFYDSVKSLHPTNRDMIRQLLKGLTHEGQLVVDPLVGSGSTGQAARSLGRRFLCFGAEEENVRAANQRIAEVRLVEESAT